MLPEELKKHIKIKAEKLQYFLDSNGHSIGIDDAINRMTNWCENFNGLIPNMEILIPVIDKLRFIKDQDIIDRVIEELKREKKDFDSLIFTTIGGVNESSNRIIRNINFSNNCIVDLHECLKIINNNQEKDYEIIFIDDFINSGGQFETILTTLFGQKEICGKDNKRVVLTQDEQELFRKTKTSFFFYLGMQTGRELAEKTINNLNLNSRITIFEQYDDLSGIFGNSNSVNQIIHGLSCYADSSSIFENYKCFDIQPFYEICKKVGEQFLRKIKPEWKTEGKEDKYVQRALGYGNSAQLFITLNNVPTSTLTAIWADGEFEIEDKIIKWLPMFLRREKKTGSEGHVDSPKKTETSIIRKNNNILDAYLDKDENSNQSFETAFIVPLRKEYESSSNKITWDKNDIFLGNTTLVINADNNIETFSVKASCLDFCNNRSKFKYKNDTFYIKNINAYKIRIYEKTYGIIRLSFKQSEITLETAIKIVDLFSQIRGNSKNNNIIITARQNYSLSDIIHKIFEIDKDIVLIEPRLCAFSFFRVSENNNIFLNNSLNPLFNYKVSSSNVREIYANVENTLSLIEAIVTLSSNGSAVLCKSNYADNNSQLQERFFKHFLFLYLLGKVQHDLQEKNFIGSRIMTYSEDICLVDCEKQYYRKWINLLKNKNGNIKESNNK